MFTPQSLTAQAQSRHSLLCVGLDPEPALLPGSLTGSLPQRVLDFNRHIIDATHDLALAYKPNLAFYESLGPEGWTVLHETVAHVAGRALVVADAKRGDIGNTARHYASAMFEGLGADAVTLSPYMGLDSLLPFVDQPGRWAFVLALTSNPGAADFQRHGQPPLYEHVLQRVASTPCAGHWGFVVGATQPQAMADIRRLVPEAWLLVPGVGAQGGDAPTVLRHLATPAGSLLLNSSRGILYADAGPGFAAAARKAAQELVDVIRQSWKPT